MSLRTCNVLPHHKVIRPYMIVYFQRAPSQCNAANPVCSQTLHFCRKWIKIQLKVNSHFQRLWTSIPSRLVSNLITTLLLLSLFSLSKFASVAESASGQTCKLPKHKERQLNSKQRITNFFLNFTSRCF